MALSMWNKLNTGTTLRKLSQGKVHKRREDWTAFKAIDRQTV